MNADLVFLELYSLDRYQQWNLDDVARTRDYYRRIDDFFRQLAEWCGSDGRSLLLFSEHGHEPIRESIDIRARLQGAGVREGEYDRFVEVSIARFWFHSDQARRLAHQTFEELPVGRTFSYQEVPSPEDPFPDDAFGETFLLLPAGWVFFPHDFHHRVANVWLGVRDPLQRPRLWSPRHRGDHSFLPNEDQHGRFALLLADGWLPEDGDATVLDLAPTILEILKCEQPSTMRGKPMFTRDNGF